MIAILEGTLQDIEQQYAVVSCGGVGYEVATTKQDQSSSTIGDKVRFFIYEHIREDSYDLYGFTNKETKKLFELLLSVNGVGPKAALSVLNIGDETQVRSAIASEDTKYISSAVGVGKRVAERIVVDLKDKVGGTIISASSGIHVRSEDEAMLGLIALGYSPSDAAEMLHGVEGSSEERIKKALKGGN